VDPHEDLEQLALGLTRLVAIDCGAQARHHRRREHWGGRLQDDGAWRGSSDASAAAHFLASLAGWSRSAPVIHE
jgi:hypothetical protein